jgi:hypothetical protein
VAPQFQKHGERLAHVGMVVRHEDAAAAP